MGFRIGKRVTGTSKKGRKTTTSQGTKTTRAGSGETAEYKYRNNRERGKISTKYGYIGKNIFVAKIHYLGDRSEFPKPLEDKPFDFYPDDEKSEPA